MQNHLTTDELSVYVDGIMENPSNTPPEILHHISECNECAAEAVELTSILEFQHEKHAVIPVRKINRSVFYIAASIIVIFTIAFLMKESLVNEDNSQISKASNKKFNNRSNKQIIFNNDSIIINDKIEIPEKNLIAEAFISNPQLEQLCERYNANMRSDDIVVSDKLLKIKINKSFTLHWKNNGNELLFVEIFDNQSKKIQSHQTNEESIMIKDKITPGLYYWKLFNEDFDLLFCGKIIVD